MASPVRVSLSAALGREIDGAWWPRSAAIARELPDLIQALYPALGEVIDININWSGKSSAPMLSTMAPEIAARISGPLPHHRLMILNGRCANTRLLVVPSMTQPALAHMVLRYAAARPIAEGDHASREFQAAERVVRAARAESASWASQGAVGPVPGAGGA